MTTQTPKAPAPPSPGLFSYRNFGQHTLRTLPAIVGDSRKHQSGGLLLGLLFGPLGVLMAFSLDGRPQCQMCGTRLPTRPNSHLEGVNSFYPHCPACKVRLDPDTGAPLRTAATPPPAKRT